MIDVSKTNELITEAADRLRNYYEAGEMIHMASSYRTGDGVTHIIDFEDLRTVVEAATRVPVQGEPNDDREALLWNIEDRLKLLEAGAREPLIRQMAWTEDSTAEVLAIVDELRGWIAVLSRATVPDAATEEAFKKAVAFDKAVALSERRQTLLEDTGAERDAATAAIERVRSLPAYTVIEGDRAWTAVDWDDLSAALDGAPEPELEYLARTDSGRVIAEGTLEHIAEALKGYETPLRVSYRKKLPYNPWLPVEGESK